MDSSLAKLIDALGFNGRYASETEQEAARRRVGERRAAAEALASLLSERDELRTALEDVVNPLGKLQRDATAKGRRLSGAAYAIANSLSFVQAIARKALFPPLVIAPLGGATAGAEPKAQHGTNPLSIPPLGGDGT